MPASFEKVLSIKANMIWNSVGNFLYLVSQWLFTYIVVWAMGFESAGVFSLAMSMATIFCAVATYSMRNYQASDIQGIFSHKDYILSRVATSLLSFFICLITLGFTDYSFYSAACIFAYTLFKGSEALSDVYQGVLQRAMRMDYIGKAYLLKSVFDLLVFSAAIILFHDLLGALIALGIVSYAVVLLYERRTAYKFIKNDECPRDKMSERGKRIWRLLVICFPIAVCGFLTNATGQIPRTYIEAEMGAEALGFYTSIAMPLMLVQVSANYFFTPLIVPLSESYYEKDWRRFFSLIKKVFLAIMVFAVVAFSLFNLFGEFIMVLLYGEEIIPYMFLMNPLIMSSLLVAVFWFLNAILIVIRAIKPLTILSLLSFLFTVFGGVPFLWTWGMNGATFVYIAALFLFIAGSFVLLLSTVKKISG